MTISNNVLPRGLAAALALILGSSVVQAREVWLEARAYTPATGALTGIPMWGYADCGVSFAGCAAATPTSPGPVITVPAGDAAGLTVHLRNSLPTEPTSIYLVGQRNAPLPVNADALRVNGRLQALTAEIAPGLDGDYSWSAADLRPGTYLYQSGSHVQLQVHMGLYGAVVHDAPNGSCASPPCAYPAVPYSSSTVMLFSEVDPALHASTTPANLTPGGYQPRILLMNGEAQPSVLPAVNAAANGTLLRLLNAGLANHAPQLVGGHFVVVAEDGYPAPVRRSQTSTLLAASKTVDVLVATGNYGLFDRMARADTTGAAPPPSQDPVAVPDVFYIVTNNNPVLIATFPSPGVLANDTDPQNDVLRVKVGSVIPTIPAGATLVVNTGTAGLKGRVQFHAPTTSWVGDAYFSYVASEAVTLTMRDSAPAVSHVVHDQHLTTLVFHNPPGTLGDHWELAGELRELPADTNVTISFVQNSVGTACLRVGEVIATIPIPASAAPTPWTYNGVMPNQLLCNRIRAEVEVPVANGVPAHTATLDANFTRVLAP
jgi:FtsP/CotA-like multicopper oxidase with cupredoxin domain